MHRSHFYSLRTLGPIHSIKHNHYYVDTETKEKITKPK